MANAIDDAISQTHTSERKIVLTYKYELLKNKWMYFNSTFYITSDDLIVEISFF